MESSTMVMVWFGHKLQMHIDDGYSRDCPPLLQRPVPDQLLRMIIIRECVRSFVHSPDFVAIDRTPVIGRVHALVYGCSCCNTKNHPLLLLLLLLLQLMLPR